MKLRQALISIAIALAACGGGGGTNNVTPLPPAPQPAVDASSVAAADPGSSLPSGWDKGAFMEIYVRGYKDSNGDGNGDLRGLTASLDYLKDLGIHGIWLMPVAASEDHDHGYAVADYRAIESSYGTLADFDEFIKQAHARGIGVIVDYVMNHSARSNPFFVNTNYRDWYIWQNPAPTGWNVFGNPWRAGSNGAYYGVFDASMPDWNLRNPQVVDYHRSNLRFWLNRGVDGFRFDAVPYLIENGAGGTSDQPESFNLMKDVQTLVKSYAQRYMVCEGATVPQRWGAAEACGGAFAFDLKDSIVNAARGQQTAVVQMAAYVKAAPSGMASMLSNHDSFAGNRLWDQVGGNLAQYKLAAATYLLMPWTPFIYYGEEIGMSGAATLSGDAALRGPMSWSASGGFSTVAPFRPAALNAATQNVAAAQADPQSLLAFYKAMLKLRNELPAIAQGNTLDARADGNVFVLQRERNGQRVLILSNYSSQPASVTMTGFGTAQAAWPAGAATHSGERFDIPAQSLQVWTY